MEIKYIDWFKNQIKKEFDNAMELSNVSYEVVEEFTNRPNANVLFILKMLTGSIENGILRIPYQLMIEIDQHYEKSVVNMLNNFAIYWNEKVVNINANLIKGFYSTATNISNNIDKGLYSANCYSININIFQYNNPLDIDTVEIDGNEIKFISFAYSYTATTNTSGGYGNSNKQISTNTSALGIYNMTFVSSAELDYLEENLITLSNINQKYNLKFKRIVSGVSKEYTIPCIITVATFSKDFNGVCVTTLSLVRGA